MTGGKPVVKSIVEALAETMTIKGPEPADSINAKFSASAESESVIEGDNNNEGAD